MKESFEKNKKGIEIMLFSAICACVGQMLWKMSATDGVSVALIGFCFYGLGALLMIIAYRFGKLSVLQPIQSINYVISIILGYIIFSEPINIAKLFAVVLIVIGVVLIAGGDK